VYDDGAFSSPTLGVRAGRTLPLAPLCSAIGAALALGTARVRDETRALEALGRSPGQTARAAALGAALPSVLIGIAIAASSLIDVSGFYPRAPRGDTFVYDDGAFSSPTLGVRVSADGEPVSIEGGSTPDEGLPRHARSAAATATAVAGVALSLVTARAILRVSLLHRRGRRRRRIIAGVQVFACVLLTLVAFQAAAARVSPAALAMLPPALLLGVALLGYRARHGHAG
jgi:lipopolysaccharide export LptBFGC system permease protein LptF